MATSGRTEFGILLASALIALASAPTPVSAASFTGLGDLPGGPFQSSATGVSADGSVVVGHGYQVGPEPVIEAFRWTSSGGMVGIGTIQPSSDYSFGTGVSGDGSVVVGISNLGFISPDRPFRWTSGAGMVNLGVLSGGTYARATAVSDNGAVIVGGGDSTSGSSEAFRWTSGGGFVRLGDLAGGSFYSVANAASADGSVVVGLSISDTVQDAFRWTSGGGMVGLGCLGWSCLATGVSADGSVVVGSGSAGAGGFAFRWTAGGGMVGIGELPGGAVGSSATGVSADGSVVVGYGNSASGEEAFIWDATNGMRELDQLLIARGVDLTGWTLQRALAISADGKTIVGFGNHAGFGQEAWLAYLGPSPAPVVPLGPVAGIGVALCVGALGYLTQIRATKSRRG